MKRMRSYYLLLALSTLIHCSSDQKDQASGNNEESTSEPALTELSRSLPLNTIELPDGFAISVYAEVEDARSMALSPSGVLYIGNKSGNKVYAVRDNDKDGKADERWVIASDLNMPNGVAVREGDLYVAEVNRILKFPDIEASLNQPPSPIVINDMYPKDTHHGWKYIAFGPDGKLYVPVGAPCNICEPDEIYATITRINPDGSGREIFSRGIRNTVGFTWHPETGALWFTDNGRDYMGNDIPPCELNKAPQANMHFGYPYCHGGDLSDPEFGDEKPCSSFTSPVQKLGPHVAPLGLEFYTGSMFPAEYKGDLFIAEHGSWNRDDKIGYRLTLVEILDNQTAQSYAPFASGWLDEQEQEAWGRPVDVVQMSDGSLLVSDDKAGVIYRITYGG